MSNLRAYLLIWMRLMTSLAILCLSRADIMAGWLGLRSPNKSAVPVAPPKAEFSFTSSSKFFVFCLILRMVKLKEASLALFSSLRLAICLLRSLHLVKTFESTALDDSVDSLPRLEQVVTLPAMLPASSSGGDSQPKVLDGSRSSSPCSEV